MDGRARQDLAERLTHRIAARTRERPRRVDRERAHAGREPVAERRVPRVDHPLWVTPRCRERTTVVGADPQDAEGPLRGRVNERPGSGDAVGATDRPLGGHRGHGLEQDPGRERKGEQRGAHLAEAERFATQSADRGSESERDQEGLHGRRQRQVDGGVRDLIREVPRRR